MDFEEYLIALGEEKLINEIKNGYETLKPLMNPVHEKALDLYKKYLVLGGMPVMIKNFIACELYPKIMEILSQLRLKVVEELIVSA